MLFITKRVDCMNKSNKFILRHDLLEENRVYEIDEVELEYISGGYDGGDSGGNTSGGETGYGGDRG
jgi:hypothetical protein